MAPRSDPELGQIAKLFGVAGTNALDAHPLFHRDDGERVQRRLGEGSVAGGNRRAMRIGRRLTDGGRIY